ncbi:MAG: helix-turn-helix domain-containing protein [Clostridiales bacterium]|jgi:transcriptional regulator with XRE-family HTH domain|nr:helix-turn-helix domain-containing protein [Clostridiales bacterium]
MKDEYSQLIVTRILSLCEKRGITIYELSIMSGVSYSTLDNILKSKTFNPKLKTMHKIAIAFSLTLAELLDFDELNRYSFED